MLVHSFVPANSAQRNNSLDYVDRYIYTYLYTESKQQHSTEREGERERESDFYNFYRLVDTENVMKSGNVDPKPTKYGGRNEKTKPNTNSILFCFYQISI